MPLAMPLNSTKRPRFKGVSQSVNCSVVIWVKTAMVSVKYGAKKQRVGQRAA